MFSVIGLIFGSIAFIGFAGQGNWFGISFSILVIALNVFTLTGGRIQFSKN